MSKPLTPERKAEIALYQKQWREANKAKLAAYQKQYRIDNPDSNKTHSKAYRNRHPDRAKTSSKKYKSNNQDKVKTYREGYKVRRNQLQQEKKQSDPLFKIKSTIRCRILKAFTRINSKKNSKTTEILGCSYEEFRTHIESLWLSWMNWQNHGFYNGTEGYGWDLDHIIPISSAVTEADVIRLNHYTNLRPLCSKINRDIKRNNPD